MPRMKLYLNFERVLTPAETDALRELVKRRGQREPLQHIIGSTSFCGLEIAVNRHALVPRPETELLAEARLAISDRRVACRLELGTADASSIQPPWTSAPAPAASPSRWRRNVRTQKSSRRIFRRKRWRWPKKMRRETTSPNGLNFCRAMALRAEAGARLHDPRQSPTHSI